MRFLLTASLSLIGLLFSMTSFANVVKPNAPKLVVLPNLTCSKIQMLQSVDENNFPVYVDSDLSIAVEPSSRGAYGYLATLSQKGKTAEQTDVQVQTVPPGQISQLEQMVTTMLPKVKFASIASVRLANVGVKDNQMDAGGAMIFELYDSKDLLLGKLAQVGWGFGLCSAD